MDKKIKIEIALGIIIITGIILGAAFWMGGKQKTEAPVVKNDVAVPAQPADDTADWKTYTNAEFGYELKYPVDFSEPFGPGNSNNPAASVSSQNPELSFQVQFFQNAFGPINSLEDAFRISTRGNGFQEKLKREITFNGTRGIEYAGYINSRNVHAFVGVLNGKYFDLVVESKSSQEEADALFQKLFSNFKDINNEDTNL